VCQFQHLHDTGWNTAEFQVCTFGPGRLHQSHQRSQAAAVHKVEPIELQDDVSVFLDRISNLRVQSENLVSGHHAADALHHKDLTNRTALQAQLHLRLLSFLRHCYSGAISLK
jgi:hypothetical protein